MSLENPRHRIAVLADQCVQCGLCLPVCPTYALDSSETESPRGRIAIAAALAKGQILPSPGVREPLDHCLGCLSCQRVCPAGVKYEELLITTRGLLGPMPDRPEMLLKAVKRPRLGRWLQRLAHWTSAKAWLPPLLPGRALAPWRAALSMLPSNPAPVTMKASRSNATASQGSTVAIFPGCTASVQDAQAERAAQTLLTAAGYRMVRMPAFCCGALDLHDGTSAQAQAAMARVRKAWGDIRAEHLITVTPGCLSTLRQALPGTRVDDPYSLLAARSEMLRFRPLAARVALHVPCTQANVARSDNALITLLQSIPGLTLKRLPPSYCCGAAGSHALQFPARAAQLRENMLKQIAAQDAQWLLSSNIGCRLHLAAGLEEQASTLPTLHPLTLLEQQWIPS